VLGWEFFVTRSICAVDDCREENGRSLASWRTGIGGTDWLDTLVSSGVATDLGGNGYPNRYGVPAGALLAIFSLGIPKFKSPPVIGDDYVQPSGWTAGVEIDIAALRAIDSKEILEVEAWDQS
jgi:hypothetical protein